MVNLVDVGRVAAGAKGRGMTSEFCCAGCAKGGGWAGGLARLRLTLLRRVRKRRRLGQDGITVVCWTALRYLLLFKR